jgi:hypothetical protein
MADLNLNQFQARPKTRHWRAKAVTICAVAGGIYGAAIGPAISTTAVAVEVIGIAAAVMAVLCGVPGSRFGVFVGLLNRVRFARLFVGALAAMGGAVIGGLLGVILVMPLGAILGAAGGWFIVEAILRGGGWLWRLQWQVLGLVLGACIGPTAIAVYHAPSAALVGVAWGFGIGAIVGPMPFLVFVKMMDSLVQRQHPQATVIDVKVKDVPDDEK